MTDQRPTAAEMWSRAIDSDTYLGRDPLAPHACYGLGHGALAQASERGGVVRAMGDPTNLEADREGLETLQEERRGENDD